MEKHELYKRISLNIFCICSLTFLLLAYPIKAQHQFQSADEVGGLAVGTTVQDFEAIDQFGNRFQLAEALRGGPVVLIFYRGQWCPVCNKHLGQLQDSLRYIEEMGARLVAVAPEQPPYLKMMAQKIEADFSLLYDEQYRISNAFEVTFLPDQATIDLYNNRLNAQLEEANTDDSGRLPIPATFIINQEGEIVWRHFDKDYRNRASAAEIIKALKHLK
jgi:peroxiredoxin